MPTWMLGNINLEEQQSIQLADLLACFAFNFIKIILLGKNFSPISTKALEQSDAPS